MVANCPAKAMWYILPMLLGRTYDMRKNFVGLDIFDKSYIDEAQANFEPQQNYSRSEYMTLTEGTSKWDFFDVSGEFGVKIQSGLVDFRGAGKYLKETKDSRDTIEVLVQMRYVTGTMRLSRSAEPQKYFYQLDKESVGTHVVTGIQYGGEVYASLKFVVLKSEYYNEIKAKILATISKKGTFDFDAEGKFDMLAKNISNQARMDITYFANVPLQIVPTTLDGLKTLLKNFKDQVHQVNHGLGVPVCAELEPLSFFDSKFAYLKNAALNSILERINLRFEDLRKAKTLLEDLVESLPETTSKEYLDEIINFSERLTEVFRKFYEMINTMDLEKDASQFKPANQAYDSNCKGGLDNDKCTLEIQNLANKIKEKDDPSMPRGVYTRWGKKTCGKNTANILDIGFMSLGLEEGTGGGFNYMCFPQNPDLKLGPDYQGLNQRGSLVGGVWYHAMSMFNKGKKLENKVASCAICETPTRPTIQMFPGMISCPGNWVQEYNGYLVASRVKKYRSEFVCVDHDPDSDISPSSSVLDQEPMITPIKMGGTYANSNNVDASLPCVVCSK